MENLAFLTPEQVADILQINKMTVYREIKRKNLRAYKFGKEFRILQADFEAYLASAYKAAQQSVYAHNTCINPKPAKVAVKAKMTQQKTTQKLVRTPKRPAGAKMPQKAASKRSISRKSKTTKRSK